MIKKRKTFLDKNLGRKFISIIFIYLIIALSFNSEVVFAQQNNQNTNTQNQQACCEKTVSGDQCVFTNINNCDRNFATSPYSCDISYFCVDICCVDQTQGCFPNTPKAICQSQSGTRISTDNTCNNTPGCLKGCCNLNNDKRYISELECRNLATNIFGQSFNFQSIFTRNTFEQCFGETLQEEGCCIENGVCSYGRRSSCAGSFRTERCSDISECRYCEPRAYKDCKNGNVYWFDSCGNPEELVEQCNFDEGKLCAKENDNIVCKSLDCETTTKFDALNYTGGTKKNGESWCVYFGSTGDFKDRPGTTHYKYSCLNGEEVIENCRYFREQVCIQGTDSESKSSAECIPNTIYLNLSTSELKIPVSTVPIGFKFWENTETNQNKCAVGTTKCNVWWAKRHRFTNWHCVANCECETQGFLDQANDNCRALGDCGFSYNVLGKPGNDGLRIEWDISGGGRGVEPTEMTSEYFDSLNKSGNIYGGMEFLNKEFNYLFRSRREFDYNSRAYQSVQGKVGLNPFVIAITSIFTGLIDLFQDGDQERKWLEVECRPWQAPLGGEDCGKCSDFSECTESLCRSLGSTCRLIDIEDGSVQCANINTDDFLVPRLSPYVEEGYTVDEQNLGYRVNELVTPLKKFTFGVITNEDAICKYDKESKLYEDMGYELGNSFFKKEHKVGLILEGEKSYTLYVRCTDINGNENEIDYTISLRTKKQQDKNAPVILGSNPIHNAILPANSQDISLELELNEPSTCKYDTRDKKYEDMNSMGFCNREFSLEEINFICDNPITLEKGINNFYVRCKDLAENVHKQSTLYRLTRSEPLVLSVDEVSPKRDVYQNNIVLSLSTTKGFDNGKSICKYSKQRMPFEEMNDFEITNGNKHLHVLSNLKKGSYNYFIKCKDSIGNEIEERIGFRVLIEKSGVVGILGIYKDVYSLYLALNTDSNCEYSDKDFVFGQGIRMGGENTTIHVAPLEFTNYIIKCKDDEGKSLGDIKINI